MAKDIKYDGIAGKSVLLIAPLFFGYYNEIMKELELLGCSVDYVCDMPGEGSIMKAAGRINKRLTYSAADRYFRNDVLPRISGMHYDYLLLVAGMTFAFSPEMVGALKEALPDALFVMYQWDSEKNLPYSTHIHRYFDRVFSFDRPDCIRNPQKYTFLPLFYIRTYEMRSKEAEETPAGSFKYDCSYVGTAHPKKFRDINIISQALESVFPNQFIYHYMPSILKYFYHKLTAAEYRDAHYSDFKTEKLSTVQILEILNDSFCVLDAPQSGQTGLTIRTIECLGAEKKIITSNADVAAYDFYRPCNILIWDGFLPDFSSSFFNSPYERLPYDVYEKYSLRAWLKTMLIG